MLDAVVEGACEQVVQSEVLGSFSDSLDLEEIAHSDACNENLTENNTSVDIVELLKSIYVGVSRKKLEVKYNIDLSALLGESAGNQSSWEGRVANANALIKNYTKNIFTAEGVLHAGPKATGTLEDILSLQESVSEDFEKKKSRIKRYHKNKKLKNGVKGDEISAQQYVGDITSNLSANRTIADTAKVTLNSLIATPKVYDPRITPKIEPLSDVHLLQAKVEDETAKDKYLIEIIPDSLLEPMDPKDPIEYEEYNVSAALEKVKEETPLLLYDKDAKLLEYNLKEEQKVRGAGNKALLTVLTVAATVVLSAPIISLGNYCEKIIQDVVPISITTNLQGYGGTSGNLSFFTAKADPIAEVLAEIVDTETLDEIQIPPPEIEYLTFEDVQAEITLHQSEVDASQEFYAGVSEKSYLTADELMAYYQIERAAESAYSLTLQSRVDSIPNNARDNITLANLPNMGGFDDRIMVIVPEGSDSAEYAIARLPGFDELSIDVRYNLMGSFGSEEIIANSPEFFSQNLGGDLVSTRACNGRWKTVTLSQIELGNHDRGTTILPCNYTM